MSGIQWTDQTWNPIRGCSRVSAGCEFCYAEAMAYRFSKPGAPYEGLVKMTSKGPRWTGEVKFIPNKLNEPLSWKKPRMVFVNSMSDLFHEKLPITAKSMIWDVMSRADKHIFQVLTKRPRQMHEFLVNTNNRVPSHIWLGVSVENQEQAELRIPMLVNLPGFVPIKFLSVEPLLEKVDLRPWLPYLQWVIVGGESGPKARFCNWKWIERIVDDCRSFGCNVFVKQLGSTSNTKDKKGGDPEEWPEEIRFRQFPFKKEKIQSHNY